MGKGQRRLLSEETFMLEPEKWGRVSPAMRWGKSFDGSGTSQCKDLKVGKSIVCSRKRRLPRGWATENTAV